MAVTNIYDRLGVQRLINGHHWRTALGGSVMPPEVVDAMAESAGYFVDLEGLHRSAGEYIAELTGADAGLVTAGCSAAQVLQAAACMTGTDDEKIARLPDSSGMKNKVLIQKSQRNHYDTSYQLAGATLVEVGGDEGATKAELEAAIDDDTAAVTYVWVMRFHALPLEDVIEVSHSRDVPVLLDAASELPPVENLSRFIRMGVDMVAFSGGKGIRGPQSTGILAGRGDLMRAAWENSFFFGKDKAGIGRPMKVAKEEIIGLVRALELFVEADHESEWVDWRAKSTTIADAAGAVDGVRHGCTRVQCTKDRRRPRPLSSWPSRGRALRSKWSKRHCGPASRRSTSASCPTSEGCGLRPWHSRGTRRRSSRAAWSKS